MNSTRSRALVLTLLAAGMLLSAGCGQSASANAPTVTYYYVPG
jgi:hypothetical protein